MPKYNTLNYLDKFWIYTDEIFKRFIVEKNMYNADDVYTEDLTNCG